MGNKVAHLAQAKHNEDFASNQNRPDYNDWVTTALFYAAIHYLEAYWAPSLHSTDHKERNENIRNRFRSNALLKSSYKTLEKNCWLARYLNADMSSNDPAQEYFTEDDIQLFIKTLNNLKAQLRIS